MQCKEANFVYARVLLAGQSPQTSRMRSALGGARKHREANLVYDRVFVVRAELTKIAHVEGAGRSPQTSRICSGAYVATLSTCSWTTTLVTHAPSIWISARFVILRRVHAVCTMRLSFMKYTIPGAEPRAPGPVP